MGLAGEGADLQPGAPHFIDDGQDSEGQADAFLAAVLHQLKLPIRRHKADHLLSVKPPQVHALVEGHILHTPPASFPVLVTVKKNGWSGDRPKGGSG